MFLLSLVRHVLFVSVPLSLILTTYLYLYPLFHLCAFPAPELDARSAYTNTLWQHVLPSSHNISRVAPFRLLALGDPQLEGESSIRDTNSTTFPNLSNLWKDAFKKKHNILQRIRHSLHDIIDFYLDDIPKALEVYRKRVDHVGNDYYLGHIYRTMHWWTDPTHVTVLGDLVGSQWINDKEFESRGWRYWNRVFRGGERVPDELTSAPSQEVQNLRFLGDDAAAWKKRIINVAGNHDIGYAGDLTSDRLERFERVFGKPNYEMRFQLPINSTLVKTEDSVEGGEERPVPELRIVVLNDMNLDTPVGVKELQDETYQFLNGIITTSKDVTRPAHFTLVLTHIPLYKDAGICVDGPFFDFFSDYFNNGVKEQNHLSRDASKGILEGIFGMSGDSYTAGQGFGRYGTVLNGHDHEGCDIYHYINQSSPPERRWEATRWKDAQTSDLLDTPGIPGIRETTVRSMMGDFAGNAGLMSLWFDEETWDWRYEFANCGLGTQHIWWTVHVWDFINVILVVVYGIIYVIDKFDLMEKFQKSSTRRFLKWVSKNRPVRKAPLVNGHTTPNLLANERNARDENTEVVDQLGTTGKLDISGAGRKSLRKKSKRSLNGSANSSVVSMYS
ncbi:hypothetical protein B0O99DRAFT_619501 [Bisporella sp. PMI_857]|nr:hypothetical protein B0O99DRAFT_619501 [Bisporella sp. PMI_857]